MVTISKWLVYDIVLTTVISTIYGSITIFDGSITDFRQFHLNKR